MAVENPPATPPAGSGYSTGGHRIQANLAGGSSALAELEDQQRRREVATAELAFLAPIEANSGEIEFLVAVPVAVSDTAGTETIEHSLTLRVQHDDDGRWAVDEFHA